VAALVTAVDRTDDKAAQAKIGALKFKGLLHEERAFFVLL